jgi:hypothetical protein
MITSAAKRGRLPPGGGTIEKLAAGLAPSVEPTAGSDLEMLDLPDVLVEWLRPPLEELGYTIERTWLPPGRTPLPMYYTVAKNNVIELTLIHLPAIFYTPTNLVALAAASLGFSFGDHPRLHLCAEEREKPPSYLDTALKGWNTRGIRARFHAWSVFSKLKTEPDPCAGVVKILELNVDTVDFVELTRAQFDVLYESLGARFPRPDQLRRFVRQFEQNLSMLSSDMANLKVNVEEVISCAQAEGWLLDLVRGAIEKDPQNDDLRQLAMELGVSVIGGAPVTDEP